MAKKMFPFGNEDFDEEEGSEANFPGIHISVRHGDHTHDGFVYPAHVFMRIFSKAIPGWRPTPGSFNPQEWFQDLETDEERMAIVRGIYEYAKTEALTLRMDEEGNITGTLMKQIGRLPVPALQGLLQGLEDLGMRWSKKQGTIRPRKVKKDKSEVAGAFKRKLTDDYFSDDDDEEF